MTTPALNAAVGLEEAGHGNPTGVSSNGINGRTVNGVHSSEKIVKEKPFNSGRDTPLRIVCIGAGAAGIYMGIKLPRTIDNKLFEFQIYEKNPKLGGCWYENTYPGCACDIPSHVYSYSFAPNPDWSHFYSSSAEIQRYFESVAIKYDVPRFVTFEHKVVGAFWNPEGFWKLKIAAPDGNIIENRADVLVNASGILNSWKWPDIEGLETFKGPKLHSANWDSKVDLSKNLRVGLIGNGSSASEPRRSVQILPRVRPLVGQLTTFIRTKTWIALPFTSESIKKQAVASGSVDEANSTDALIDPATSNPPYTDEERHRFNADESYLRQYRKKIEQENNGRFAASTLQGSPGAELAIKRLTGIMQKRLASKPELAELLIPEWHVGCRRLTPGVGYLEALCEDNVKVVTTGIKRITGEGVETHDGSFHPCDILLCATGFDVSTRPRFEVLGRDGYRFTDAFAKSPRGYLTLTMSNMPNYFIFNGPNAPIANGSLLPAMEKEGDYMIKMIQKMLREDVRSFCIKTQAEDDFVKYTDSWMPRSIWASGCRSWYKGGTVNGRVTGVWPGSILHFMDILANPRWEDYDYEYLDRRNRFAFFGNGFTLADITPGADTAPYLDTAVIPV